MRYGNLLCNGLSYLNLIGHLEGDIFPHCPHIIARAYSNAEVIQCSPHNLNPLNKNFRLLRKNPGSHHRNNTKNSNGKIRLNRR